MEDKPSKQGTAAILYPLLLSLILAGGYYLGTLHTNKTQVEYISNQNGLIKLNRVLNEIELKYVDSTSPDQLVETSIPGILQNLDPHSSYIPAKNLSSMD